MNFLMDEEGTLARATAEVPEALPPTVTLVLVMSQITLTSEVPAWCWHSATEERKIIIPDDAKGKYFELPGENPIAHTMHDFIWPNASVLVWVENVHDTSKSR